MSTIQVSILWLNFDTSRKSGKNLLILFIYILYIRLLARNKLGIV